MNVFTLLVVISKRFKLELPDGTHFVDFLMTINLFVFLSCLAFLEAEISLIEEGDKLFSKVVGNYRSL